MNGTLPALIKIMIFAVITVLLTALLGTTIANTNFGTVSGYTAVFTDASGIQEGDDVRIVGVKVGQVQSINVDEHHRAEVHFEVEAARALPAESTATVKYRNLVGQRYLSIGTDVQGKDKLPAGGIIPQQRTQPALNLTVLFNGFKPLFQALNPEDINKLSYEIIQVFQGEGGTIKSLLSHTASVTSAIANKDKVIGQVIDNLNNVLQTVNSRTPQVTNMIDQTQRLVSGLAEQREPIGNAVSALGDLTKVTTGFLRDVRPPLQDDIAGLNDLSGNLADSRDILEKLLQRTPGNLERFIRPLSYGSWFNYYSCAVSGTVGIKSLNITLPVLPLPTTERAPRCEPS